jgi:hypothetical protein
LYKISNAMAEAICNVTTDGDHHLLADDITSAQIMADSAAIMATQNKNSVTVLLSSLC